MEESSKEKSIKRLEEIRGKFIPEKSEKGEFAWIKRIFNEWITKISDGSFIPLDEKDKELIQVENLDSYYVYKEFNGGTYYLIDKNNSKFYKLSDIKKDNGEYAATCFSLDKGEEGQVIISRTIKEFDGIHLSHDENILYNDTDYYFTAGKNKGKIQTSIQRKGNDERIISLEKSRNFSDGEERYRLVYTRRVFEDGAWKLQDIKYFYRPADYKYLASPQPGSDYIAENKASDADLFEIFINGELSFANYMGLLETAVFYVDSNEKGLDGRAR